MPWHGVWWCRASSGEPAEVEPPKLSPALPSRALPRTRTTAHRRARLDGCRPISSPVTTPG